MKSLPSYESAVGVPGSDLGGSLGSAQTSQGICTNDSKGNYFHENLEVLEAMHAIQAQEASHFFHDTLAHHLRVSRFVVFLVPNALKNSKITPEIQTQASWSGR